MAKEHIESASAGDMSTAVDDYSVDTQSLDSVHGMEITWTNTKWAQYLGYYKTIPELGAAIDAKGMWTVGKGFKADKKTTKILNTIRGWGKDSFNNLMENAVRTYNIGGDSYAEIITTDGKPIKPNGSNLLNLKPLNPETMVHVVGGDGLLTGYEQTNRVAEPNQKFDVEQIFHLPWNRLADEIHGISIIEKIENIILSRNEAMSDMKTVFHRYVKPLWIWQLDTDDTTKIATFKRKADTTVANSENIYIPRGAAEAERVSVPQYSTLDPLPWIKDLNNYFYQATGIPDVILGTAKETTEASAKILYLAFQQSIEKNQLFLEEQIKAQLGLDVEFEFPASIEADLLKNIQKEGEKPVEPNDTTASLAGKK